MVENNVRLEGKSGGQDFIELPQVLGVIHTIGQGQVKPATFLAEWKIAFAVDGEGEDIGIVLKYLGRAVTLMDIEIDQQPGG